MQEEIAAVTKEVMAVSVSLFRQEVSGSKNSRGEQDRRRKARLGLKKNRLLRWYPTDRQSREVELAVGLTACRGWDRRLRRGAGLAAGGRGELGLRRAAGVVWLRERGALQGRRRKQRRDR